MCFRSIVRVRIFLTPSTMYSAFLPQHQSQHCNYLLGFGGPPCRQTARQPPNSQPRLHPLRPECGHAVHCGSRSLAIANPRGAFEWWPSHNPRGFTRWNDFHGNGRSDTHLRSRLSVLSPDMTPPEYPFQKIDMHGSTDSSWAVGLVRLGIRFAVFRHVS